MPPPGFDALTVEEQIDYVQSLWEHIAAHPKQVSVPEWHRQVLAERLAAYETKPTEGKTWEEFDQKFLVTCGGNRGMLTNLDPNNPVFYWARGHAYDENANNVGAIENYTKAISLMTSNSSTLITYGGKSINLIDLYEDRASS